MAATKPCPKCGTIGMKEEPGSEAEKAKPKLAEKPVVVCRICERKCYSKYELKHHVCKVKNYAHA